MEEREDEREEEDEDEQEERAKVDVTKAVDEAASTPEASGENQHLCEDVQLQPDLNSVWFQDVPAFILHLSGKPRPRPQRPKVCDPPPPHTDAQHNQ